MKSTNPLKDLTPEEYLEQKQSTYTEDLRFSEMDWKNSVDIDNYEDIQMAEVLYEYLKRAEYV